MTCEAGQSRALTKITNTVHCAPSQFSGSESTRKVFFHLAGGNIGAIHIPLLTPPSCTSLCQGNGEYLEAIWNNRLGGSPTLNLGSAAGLFNWEVLMGLCGSKAFKVLFHTVCPPETVSNQCDSTFLILLFHYFLSAKQFILSQNTLPNTAREEEHMLAFWLFSTTFLRCTRSVGTWSAFHANKGDSFTKCFTTAEQGLPAC